MGGTRQGPSVVFFMVDQLAARWWEQALEGVVPVPNFRRLRAAGVTFRNAFTTNPVCCPARATIATGLTGRGHGVPNCGYDLDPTVPTFMQVLQGAGWRTGAFGKVHLITQLAGVRHDYRPYGFDVTAITEDTRAGEWLDWVKETHPEHYEAALATVWTTMAPELGRYGPAEEDLAARIHAIRRGVRWATPELPGGTPEVYTLPFPAAVSQTEWITGRALEFIRTTRPDQPLLAHVSYVQPHNPFAAPAEYVPLVDDSRIPPPLPAEWETDPAAPALFRDDPQRDAGGAGWLDARRLYFADIAHLDAQLGLLLGGLEEAGRLDQTYVIFLTDHGELLYDHGFVGKWGRHYDACIRIPLAIMGPGVRPGVALDHLVDLTDIAPTVLDVAGLEPPRLRVHGRLAARYPAGIPLFPGHSLRPLCEGREPPDWRTAVYVESSNTYWAVGPRSWARTIRTADHRYTYYPEGGGEQLFDLRDDPDEQRNHARDPACAEVRQRLRDRLLDLIVAQDYPGTPRGLYAVGAW